MLKTSPYLKVAIIILVSVLILSALLGQIFYQQQKLLKSHEWVVHTLEVRDVADKLSVEILEGTSAVRGLLLTNDKNFLPGSRQLIENAPVLYKQLDELTHDNPVQQKHTNDVAPLLQQRIQLVQSTIDRYPELNADDKSKIAIQGEIYSQNINALISQIQNEEKQLLAKREAELQQNVSGTTVWSITVVSLFILVIAGLAWSFNKEWLQRQTLLEKLAFLNSELETRNANLEAANETISQANRLKTEFLSAMSHELRTPLNSIIGFTGILRMGIAGAMNDEQKKQLGMINDSAQHLLSLINDLLDLSRIESGRAELSEDRFDLNDVVADVLATISPLAAKKSLTLKDRCKDQQTLVISDRRKVYQILLNLVSNAVKFSDHGEIEINCHSSDQFWLICVTDQGIGIKPENLPSLFEAFRQLDGSVRRVYEGTGLGLYLSKKLVEMLGGSITAASEIGKGSQFCFTLPRHSERAGAVHEHESVDCRG